jgi:tetratricopeptide (TPR) repeat protein
MDKREQVESPPDAHSSYSDQAGQELWQRWRQGHGPTLQEVLAHAGELTASQLAAALAADQHENWQHGKRTPAEVYLQHYPMVSSDEEAACDLVYGEFLLRQELGEAPSLQEYLDRFPRLADGLQQLHQYAQFNSVLHWLPLASAPDRGEAVPPAPPELADYELLKWIGAGTFGDVWLARNRHDGGLCAVKIVAKRHQSELDGVKLYRQSASDHPSLVAIKHVGEGDGFYYYVMPLADDVREGTLSHVPEQYEPMTLRRHLARRQHLPADEVVAIARQLLSALAQLHKRGVSHCDVKPDNVLRVRGNWQLGDVGLAVLSAHMSPDRGTLAYFPPEGPHDQSADLYALGKTLYQLLTGAGLERFQEFAEGTLAIPGGDPRGRRLRQIILRACHPDARQRFDSAAAMLRDLDEASGIRRRKYRLLAAICVLVILLGGGTLALWNALSPPGAFTLAEAAQITRLGSQVRKLQNEGKFAEAIPVQEERVQICIRALGTTDVQTVGGQQDLATIRRISELPRDAQNELAKIFGLSDKIRNLFKQGYLYDAIAHQRIALKALRKYIQDDDQTVAREMLYLGFLLRTSKDYDESEKLCNDSLAMLLRLLGGTENWDTTTARNNLAGCLFGREQYELAEIGYRDTLEKRLNMKQPPPHDLTIISRINLAKTLRKLGKDAEADEEFRRAGKECFRLSDDDVYKASICIGLAEDHELQNQPKEAQDCLEWALRIVVRQQGEESAAAAGVHMRLATHLVAQGAPNEADKKEVEKQVTKAMWFFMPRMLPLNATAVSMEAPMACLGTLALVPNPAADAP